MLPSTGGVDERQNEEQEKQQTGSEYQVMFQAAPGRSDLLDLFEESVIGEKYACGFPEIEQVNNDRNGKCEEGPEEGRI